MRCILCAGCSIIVCCQSKTGTEVHCLLPQSSRKSRTEIHFPDKFSVLNDMTWCCLTWRDIPIGIACNSAKTAGSPALMPMEVGTSADPVRTVVSEFLLACMQARHVDRMSLRSSVRLYVCSANGGFGNVLTNAFRQYIYLRTVEWPEKNFSSMEQQYHITDRDHGFQLFANQPLACIPTPHGYPPHSCSTTILHNPLRHPRPRFLRSITARR